VEAKLDVNVMMKMYMNLIFFVLLWKLISQCWRH